MTLKKLEVPTSSITEVKKSPMSVFKQAEEAETGVYIFNREKVAGVMLTQELYEGLLEELEQLRDQQITAMPEQPLPDEVSEIAMTLNRYLAKDSVVPAKYLDERMVATGFITKKTGFGGVTEMMKELRETGKILYQSRKRHGMIVFAEIIGEVTEYTQTDKIMIHKIQLITKS